MQAEVDETRRNTPRPLKNEERTAELSIGAIAAQAAKLDGQPSNLDAQRFAHDFRTLEASGKKAPGTAFRNAEIAAVLPMVGDGRVMHMPASAEDTSRLHSPRNGSFFSADDLAKLSRGESVSFHIGKGRSSGLDMNSPVDKVISLISANEGKANTITWNDNGAGMSVGMQQNNQKRGSLPQLLRAMHDSNPEKFDHYFGRNANNMLNERFVRRAHFSPNNELGRAMVAAVNDPEMQKAQLGLLRNHVARASDIARGLGIKSTMGVALVADLTNQFGEGGAMKYLRSAHGRVSEADKIRTIGQNSARGHFTRTARYNQIVRSGIVSSNERFEV